MQKGKLLALVMALVLMLAVAVSASAELTYKVDAPSGYKTSGLKYPVIYVMPQDGYAQDNSGITSKLFDAMDKDISMDVIVVRPTFSASDNVHDVMAQIIADVDANYPTVADSKYRAVVGTAVGGQLAYELTFFDNTGKVVDNPQLFGFVASINGNFDESFFKTFTKYVDNSSNIIEYLNQFYSYLDTPVDSEWANASGSTNDLGQKYINWGISSNNCEYTARLGDMTDAFLMESVNRVADRFSLWILFDILSGSFTLKEPAVNQGKNAVIESTINVSNELTAITNSNISINVTMKLTDPITDKVVSTDQVTYTLGANSSDTKTLSLKNTVSGDSGIVSMHISSMGKTYQVSKSNMVSVQTPIYNGDYQAISLLGDWNFKYLASSFFGAPTLNGTKLSDPSTTEYTDAQNWVKVIPGLDRWTLGFGGITMESLSNWSFILNYGYGVNDIIYGNGYYVKTFNVSEKFNTDSPILSLGYLDDRCEVWLNGKRVGGTGIDENGKSTGVATWTLYSAFELDPKDIKVGENVLVVRVQNDDYGGGGGWYGGPIGLYSPSAFDDVNPEKYDPYFYEEEFYSEALERNNEYMIYLPKDYYESDRFYPTMYLLHQFNSDHASYAADNIDKEMNEAIEKGLFDEMIVVIPNSSDDSWWKDEWEDMVVEDLIPHIEEKYRAIPDARYRLTAGCSMGGQGAFSVALRNPNEFSGAAAFYGAFDYGDGMGKINPITLANEEGAVYMDYFTMAFICGNQDNYKFGNGKIELHQLLEKYGIDNYFFIENGSHSGEFYLPYFQQTIEYVRDNMYKSTSGSAASLINVNYAASSEVLTATFTADEAIRKYFNVIPASKYTKDTNPGVTLPVVATIKYEVKPGALAFLYATALAETKEVQVKFNVTFDDNNLIVTENVDLTGVLPKNAVVHHVDFHTQLLGRDHVSDNAKVEELKVMGVDLPQTGDNSNIFLFAALLMASVIGMAVIGKKKASC